MKNNMMVASICFALIAGFSSILGNIVGTDVALVRTLGCMSWMLISISMILRIIPNVRKTAKSKAQVIEFAGRRYKKVA